MIYRGCRAFVTCQAEACRGRVKSAGVGHVGKRFRRLYECERGHRFALMIAAPFADVGSYSGELDSGESTAALVSGEMETAHVSGETHAPHVHGRDCSHWTDSRTVVMIPNQPPVFGQPV